MEKMSSVSLIKDDSVRRIRRIVGQMQGIERMINKEEECAHILTQISAIRNSLLSLSTLILENHINHCVKDDLAKGGFEKIEELNFLLTRLIK